MAVEVAAARELLVTPVAAKRSERRLPSTRAGLTDGNDGRTAVACAQAVDPRIILIDQRGHLRFPLMTGQPQAERPFDLADDSTLHPLKNHVH